MAKKKASKPKIKSTGCCPPFNPAGWQEKTLVLKDRLFLKTKTMNFFYIPLNMNAVMLKAMNAIEKTKAYAKEPFMLMQDKPFGSDVLIEVSKNVPGYKMEKISGTFLTKVFEGPYNQMGGWMKEMQEYAKKKGKQIKMIYTFYTTCPACAKVYGKNYVVLLAQI